MKNLISHSIFAILFSLSICISSQSYAQANQVPDDQEFQALKALYDSLDGPNWTNKTNWPAAGSWPATATAAQMGTWFGITALNGDISKVILPANNLTGKVPAAISQITQVSQIQLSVNHLNNSLPSSLGSLSKLVWLRLENNQLTGQIPESLGNLQLLQHLYLNNNSFSGTIPEELGLLSSLQILALSTNQLTGPIPESLGGLSDLTYLSLYVNQLSGSIPGSLSNLSGLISLQLHDNQLSGNIPPSLGQLANLRVMYLYDNFLTGPIPASFGSLSNLENLRLHNNRLTGNIPPELGGLTDLTSLFIYQNKLTGELPSSLDGLVKLQHFRAQFNQLTGKIPTSYASLTELVSLNLSDNDLYGELPDIFGGLTKLTDLTLSKNNFTGVVPASIGNCVALANLLINLNKFSGLPSTILSLPAMIRLNFEGNELSVIPALANHVNKANLNLWMRDNRLDFSQLEPLINAGILLVVYAPQKAINDVSSVPLTVGSQLVLTARPTGQFSTVVWEKQNADGTWATLANDQDSNPQTYTRTTAALTDEGIYRWRMTNTKATALMLQSDQITIKTPTRFVLDDLAFQYKYDGRKRMTHKKVPGADWVYMVYDDRDRLVMTQDGEQRKTNKWSFTKYDALNRPIMTGIYTHSAFADQAGMSGLISTTNLFETYNADRLNHGYSKVVFPVDDTELLTVTYYDHYDFATNDAYRFKDDELADQYRYSAGSAFPRVTGQVTGSKIRMLSGNSWTTTVNYYDDKYRVVQVVADNNKSGIDRTTNIFDFVGKVLETKTSHSASELQWKDVVGMEVAGSTLLKTAITGWGNSGAVSVQTLPAGTDGWMEVTVPEPGWAKTVGFSSSNPNASFTSIAYGFNIQRFYYINIYENGVRPAQSQDDINVLPGDTLRIARTGTTIRYYKNGTLLYTSAVPSTTSLMIDCALKEQGGALQNVRASFIPASQSVIYRSFDHDHAGRLLKTWHSVNGEDTVLLAQNAYNELGQLVTRNLHNEDPESTPDANRDFKQQVDYRYNIRGWLTRINNSDVSIAENGPRDHFGMDLFYNEAVPELSGYQPQFNGNISAMKWSANLGLGASAPNINAPGGNAYAFRYDTLNRLKSAGFHKKLSNGWSPSAAYHEDSLKYDLNGNIRSLRRTTTEGAAMDRLAYAYNGNQLLKVSDASDRTKGFVDGPNPDNDYAYDANGNMTLDRNKNITTITYNHLNLPDKVTKRTGEYVKYTYDATGRKLSQGVYNAGNVLQKKTDYAGELFYENDTLKFINHEEGRVVMTDTAPEYQYHLKDIWNNTRVTFTTKSDVDTGTATMEDVNALAENAKFLYYAEAVKVNTEVFDRTNAGTTYYSTRLNGSTNERTGLARSISAMPGDTVKMEVYAKYLDTNSSNWTTALNNFMTAIANSTAPAGTVIDGGVAGSMGGATPPWLSLLNKDSENGTAPKAYLNYIIFDRNYNYLNGGFVRMTTAAREYGQDGAHEKLAVEFVVTEPGYVYIYLSNDNAALGGSNVEVYFDDFNVTQVKSPIIQVEDYTPFGVTFNSYSRENALLNKIKFQGQERITDLDLSWDSFRYRNYVSDIGRFFNVDPLADKYIYNSPYAFAENKLGRGIELEGKELLSFLEGAANAIWTNHHPTQAGRGMGLSTTKDQDAYMRGQQAGDVVSLVVGGVEAIGGALTSTAGVVAEIPTVGLSTVAVVAGAAMAVEGVVVANNAGSNLLNTDGQVYKVPGNKTQSGKPYIGRTRQGSPERRGQGANDGRDRTDAEVIDSYDSNNPGEGAYKEQKAIDNNGGIENLDNKRNEVNSEKMKELEKKYGQSNSGSNGGAN